MRARLLSLAVTLLVGCGSSGDDSSTGAASPGAGGSAAGTGGSAMAGAGGVAGGVGPGGKGGSAGGPAKGGAAGASSAGTGGSAPAGKGGASGNAGSGGAAGASAAGGASPGGSGGAESGGAGSGAGGSGPAGSAGMAGSATAGTSGAAGSGGSAAGSGGASGTGGTGAVGGSGGSAGASGTSGTSGAGGGPACAAGCGFNPGFTCCNDACINPMNDVLNCGKCGNVCPGDHPFCDNGTCGAPTCTGVACAGTQFCCGMSCCDTGQLCCSIPGPVSIPLTCATPTSAGTCPTGCTGCVCNSPDTAIATAEGDRPIASLHEGDLVYSMNLGRLALVPITRVHRADAPGHSVVRVTLETGRVLEISAPHPTADGRTFGELRGGDLLDGVKILAVSRIPYAHEHTYDILPASDSATYFAGGVLIGSTLGANHDVRASVATAAPMSFGRR